MSAPVLLRGLIAAILTILIAGCSGVSTRLPPPVEDRGSAAPPDTRIEYGRSSVEAAADVPLESAPAQQPPVIIALLAQAETQANDGDLSTSVATLERALRIEPRNPLLWHHLASVRLEQGEYSQAEQIAMKSNSFAAGARKLQTRNWRLIAEARKRLGDTTGASQAERRARSLENNQEKL